MPGLFRFRPGSGPSASRPPPCESSDNFMALGPIDPARGWTASGGAFQPRFSLHSGDAVMTAGVESVSVARTLTFPAEGIGRLVWNETSAKRAKRFAREAAM